MTLTKKPLDQFDDFPDWVRLSESSYAVTANVDADQIYNHFKPLLDNNDVLYVIRLSGPPYGQGDDEVNQWLMQNLN